MQLTDANEKSKQQIDVFKATTDRLKVRIEAKKAEALINEVNTKATGNQLDNEQKVVELDMADIESMTTQELFDELLAS